MHNLYLCVCIDNIQLPMMIFNNWFLRDEEGENKIKEKNLTTT